MNDGFDHEKVIKGLECCVHPGTCSYCPFDIKGDNETHTCLLNLINETYKMVKAQEPRVMTLEEVAHVEYVWIEYIKSDDVIVAFPWDIELTDDTYNFICMPNAITEFRSSYGKEWRCWTHRPTKKQREAAKWN